MERVEFLMLRLLEQYRRQESTASLIAALGRIEQELLLSLSVDNNTYSDEEENHFDVQNEVIQPVPTTIKDNVLPIVEVVEAVIQPKPLPIEEVLQVYIQEEVIVPVARPPLVPPLHPLPIVMQEINEQHSMGSTEVAQQLQEIPIKDLRKAIGINDKYLFINELFGGDEKVFEQSIKTIQQFNIYAEAEFWVKKELLGKYQWNTTLPVVQQFMQLVKRRFA
jgi:hypothetical protein